MPIMNPATGQEEVSRRTALLQHAIASASLEGIQIDGQTQKLALAVAKGHLTDEEAVRRILRSARRTPTIK